MGLAPGVLPGRVSLGDGRDWYMSHWGSLPESPGLDTAGMLEAAGDGEIGTLVLLGADPLSDFPDRRLATRALEQVPFIVAVDVLASPSTLLADIVLPAATSIERAGSTTNLEGRISRLAQKVVPPGQARPDWMIAVEIAELLGRDLGLESVDGIWEEIERLSPVHRGCTLTALLSHGATDGIVVPVRATAVAPRIVQRIDPMATPGITSVGEQGAPLYAGAVAAPDDTDDAQHTDDSGASGPLRPSVMKMATVQFTAPPSPPPDGYAFRLVTRRSLYDHGTLVQAAPSLAPLVPSQAIRLRNKEIEQLGVREGDDVRVRSLTGELVVPVVADDSLPAGVAVLAFAVVPVDQPSVADLLDSASIVSQVRVETPA
jgi:predicted molibdopterin-dependent oxidoreductase YjgC